MVLFIPAALLSLGLAELAGEQSSIRWEPFTVVAMEQHLAEGRPVLVLGTPQGGVSHLSSIVKAEFESLLLRRHCRAENYAMLCFEYTPWGSPDSSIHKELSWILEYGGYKEPSLVRVETDGTTSAIRSIFSGRKISEFLSPEQTTTRKPVYFGLAALTLIGWTATIVVHKLAERRITM